MGPDVRLHAVLVMIVLGLHVPGQTRAQASRWDPNDFVVLRDFGDVRAVAVTNAGLFAATSGGIAVYDIRLERWIPPVTELDGLSDVAFATAVADPADESVWFATTSSVVQYLPILREVVETPTSGMPVRLVFDRDDPFRGLYVATRSGWFFVPRGAGVAVPVSDIPPANKQISSLSVEDVLDREPGARATQSMVLVDPRTRRYRFTSVAMDPSRGTYYFGTDGMGVAKFDPALGEFEPLSFGLLSNRVGAVFSRDGTVWVGTGGRDGRRGFTRLESDLQYTEWDEGPGAATYQFSEVRALQAWDGGIWAATDIGVLRVDEPDLVVSRDLPSPSIYSLATTPVGLWVGTARGLAMLRRFETAGVVVEEAQATTGAVLSLVGIGHDVWIGTSNGLRWLPISADAPTIPAGVQAMGLVSEPVVSLVQAEGKLFAATRDEIFWRGVDSTWVVGPEVVATVGRITSMTVSSITDNVWIGGSRGVASFNPETSAVRLVLSARDLPGSVNGLHEDGGFLWVATDRGLVRFRVRR